MPVTVKQIGTKYRVVEARTGKLVRRGGKPVDGGGYVSKAQATKQARAINANTT